MVLTRPLGNFKSKLLLLLLYISLSVTKGLTASIWPIIRRNTESVREIKKREESKKAEGFQHLFTRESRICFKCIFYIFTAFILDVFFITYSCDRYTTKISAVSH